MKRAMMPFGKLQKSFEVAFWKTRATTKMMPFGKLKKAFDDDFFHLYEDHVAREEFLERVNPRIAARIEAEAKVQALAKAKAGEAGTRSVPPEAKAYLYSIKTLARIAVERATGGKNAERKAAALSKLLCKRLKENSRT